MEMVTKNTYLKSMLIILKNCKKEQSDFPFLPETMKIDKCEKLLCNLYDNKNYFIPIKALK